MGLSVTAIRPSSVVCDPTDVSAPAANTAAVVTYTASATGQAHVLSGVLWSYSGTPTSGNLKIEDGAGNTILSMDIAAAGPGHLTFDPFRRGTVNTAMVLTLAAGGAGVAGKLSVASHWTE